MLYNSVNTGKVEHLYSVVSIYPVTHIIINPSLTGGLVYPYHLDESIYIFRFTGCCHYGSGY